MGSCLIAYGRPKHRHTSHSHTVGNYFAAAAGGDGGVFTYGGAGGGSGNSDGGSGNTNDSLDAPAYIVLNYIIKT